MFMSVELEDLERLMVRLPNEEIRKKVHCCGQRGSFYSDHPLIADPPIVQKGSRRCFGTTLTRRMATEILDTSDPKTITPSSELPNAQERIGELLAGQQALNRMAKMLFPIAEIGHEQPTCDLFTQRMQIHEKMRGCCVICWNN